MCSGKPNGFAKNSSTDLNEPSTRNAHGASTSAQTTIRPRCELTEARTPRPRLPVRRLGVDAALTAGEVEEHRCPDQAEDREEEDTLGHGVAHLGLGAEARGAERVGVDLRSHHERAA